MINWNNSQYTIKLPGLPGFVVFNRKAGRNVKVCDSLEEAKMLIERLMRKEKK